MAVQFYNHIYRFDDDNDYNDLATYRKTGGFEALEKAIALGPDGILAEMRSGVIRGRGGAGFPAGIKWGFLPRDSDKPKYLAINADEGEPGTFKDNYILSHDPFPMIEGALICARALGITTIYCYIRGEFAKQIENVERAAKQCYDAGLMGKDIMGTAGFDCDFYVHPGAGAYICGEETAMLESIEGKPGQPRLKPPFPAVVGLFGCPTIINNVETLASVPLVINNGADWWNGLGIDGDGGSRMVGVSGHVKKPGLFEVAVGSSMKEIIYEVCGGILEDRALKAVIPGGASCPVLLPDEIDVPMSVDGLRTVDSMLGTCGIIVVAEGTCAVQCLLRLLEFYKHESCGQCTPCREGTGWVTRIVKQIEQGIAEQGDLDKLIDIADQIGGNTICAFGEAVSWPTLSWAKKFRAEFQAHIDQGGCPFEGKPLPLWQKPV